jgi:hypothetical protein
MFSAPTLMDVGWPGISFASFLTYYTCTQFSYTTNPACGFDLFLFFCFVIFFFFFYCLVTPARGVSEQQLTEEMTSFPLEVL